MNERTQDTLHATLVSLLVEGVLVLGMFALWIGYWVATP